MKKTGRAGSSAEIKPVTPKIMPMMGIPSGTTISPNIHLLQRSSQQFLFPLLSDQASQSFSQTKFSMGFHAKNIDVIMNHIVLSRARKIQRIKNAQERQFLPAKVYSILMEAGEAGPRNLVRCPFRSRKRQHSVGTPFHGCMNPIILGTTALRLWAA